MKASLFRFSRILMLMGLILTSCGSGNKEMPIPIPVMTDILTEIHLGQGYFGRIGLTTPRWQDSIPYNRHIVERRGYTWAQFDSTLTLICIDSRLFESVYDKVNANLNALSVLASLRTHPDTLMKEKNLIYPVNKSRGTFERFVVTRGPGTYTLYADVKVYPQDGMDDPRFIVWLESPDSIGRQRSIPISNLAIRTLGNWTEFKAQKTIGDTEQGVIYLRVFDSNVNSIADTTWTQYAEIRRAFVTFEPQEPQEPQNPQKR